MKALFTVLAKELKDLVRDRRTLVIALLMGPVLVPALMVGMTSFMAKKMSTQLEEVLELPVEGAEHAPNLVAWLEAHNVDVLDAPADVDQAVRDQQFDVVLVIPEGFGADWRGSQPATVELVRDASRQDSGIPSERTERLLQAYAQQVGALRLVARGIAPTVAQPLLVAERDLSTPESRAARAMAFLPYFLIIIAFLGGAYLVIDITAGERERQSLEPLLATPAARGAIMSGKIGAAIVFGLASLLLTLVGFKVGFAMAPDMGLKLDVSGMAIAKMLLILVPMLLIGTTLLTLISASVKSVKEAQSYMSVLMLVPMIPSIYLMLSPVKNQLWMFATPFLAQNQMLMMVLRAEPISALQWAVYMGAGFGAGLLLWVIAARLYHREKLAISA
jgi:sodium transport system permease protein